eukprot:s254_g19.t1
MRMLVVGIVELDHETKKETGRVVLRLVRNRSSRTLTNLVRSIVRPGTIVELDHETKKETGRVVLRLVRNRSSRTLTNLVRSIVRPGTTVVTDEWRGYNGLSKAGYKHQKVNHSKNEKVNAEGLGTNPVEGLFSSPRHICCVDECFLAKRKPSKQLRGRSTRPMRMLVVGIVEFDHETKKETGRVVLRLVRNRSSRTLTNLVRSIVRPGTTVVTVRNRSSRTLTNLVRSIVRPGTTVVTDEWRGYNGLSKAGYKHQKVNHSKNEKVNAEGHAILGVGRPSG